MCVCFLGKEENGMPEYSHEKRLVDKIMYGYDNTVRPVKNASDAIVIRLGITLTQIFDLVRKFFTTYLIMYIK